MARVAVMVFIVRILSAAPLVSSIKIPRHLILTGKPDSLAKMGADVRANVDNNLLLSAPSYFSKVVGSLLSDDGGEPVKPRWFGDKACREYIATHYDEELLGFFDHAGMGAYRGDICRAAVLYKEGGFYTDVDVELAVPLTELVDADTTFMSAYSVNGDIFNGLLAVEPKSEVLGETLQEIRRWFRGESEQVGLMGTMTMLRGIENVVRMRCPLNLLEFMKTETQWPCGKEQIRLYKESPLDCDSRNGGPPRNECPPEREGASEMLRLGLFYPNMHMDRTLIGWPRYHSCKDPQGGCGSGGHVMLQKRRFLRRRSTSP